ncbi:MAG: hypothetical protein IJY84_06720 [Clostridia bacterium]|nr:hypothetical protein [Clostridia bacterium]
MKKIIALILSLVMLLGLCSSCKADDIIYGYEFTTSKEFWTVMNKKIDFYDYSKDYCLFKWGNNPPAKSSVIAWKAEKQWSFDSISMTLALQDAKFGDLTMSVHYYVENAYIVKDYQVYRDGGYEIKYVDKNYSTTVSNYYAYYYEGPYMVKFAQTIYKTSVAGQNNYSLEDFLSHIPSILASKYKL